MDTDRGVDSEWTRTPGIDTDTGMDMYTDNGHGHGHGHRAWTCSPGMNMDTGHGPGHWAWTWTPGIHEFRALTWIWMIKSNGITVPLRNELLLKWL
jgi:hypothetical protein